MTSLYKTDRKITDILSSKKFTVSAEVIPPRNGTPQVEVMNQLEAITKAGAQFLSVTKGAGGSLRGGSLPLAQAIKEHFAVPSIAHFTCRDLTPEECENQLMDHHYFGIRNILALRGDPPVGVENWTPNPLSYPYAYQLIQQLNDLNNGIFLERKGFTGASRAATDFCIGAASYPEEDAFEKRIGYFKKKVEAGALYSITQMIYDVDAYKKFLDEIAKEKSFVPVLPGVRILRTQAQALRMQERFQIKVPPQLMKSLPETENPQKALEIFLKLTQEFKAAGAPGIHVFVLTDTTLSAQAIEHLQRLHQL